MRLACAVGIEAQAKLDLKPHVDALQAKFDAATAKLGEIATVTDEKWDGLAKEVDGAWTATNECVRHRRCAFIV